MESGRRGGRGSRRLRIDGLIPLRVAECAAEVRRQRRQAPALQSRLHRCLAGLDLQHRASRDRTIEHCGPQTAEAQPRPATQPSRRAHQGLPPLPIDAPQQQRLHPAAAPLLDTDEPGPAHPSVVDDNQVKVHHNQYLPHLSFHHNSH